MRDVSRVDGKPVHQIACHHVRRRAGEPGPDAKAEAELAGRRRVEMGAAGVGHERRAASEHARFGLGTGSLCHDLGGYRGRAGLSD